MTGWFAGLYVFIHIIALKNDFAYTHITFSYYKMLFPWAKVMQVHLQKNRSSKANRVKKQATMHLCIKIVHRHVGNHRHIIIGIIFLKKYHTVRPGILFLQSTTNNMNGRKSCEAAKKNLCVSAAVVAAVRRTTKEAGLLLQY